MLCNPSLRYIESRMACIQQTARRPMPTGRRRNKHLLFWQASPDTSDCRNVIAVGTDDDCPVEDVVDRIFQKCQREVDIGFLLLVMFPLSAAFFAVRALFAEPGNVTFNARTPECCHGHIPGDAHTTPAAT